MTSPTPPTMQALALNHYGPPSTYTILTIPTPKITSPSQVLIKVHAASINPTDIGTASGVHKIIISLPMPVKLGYDLSGTVFGVRDKVTKFKEGDEVFGCLTFQEQVRLFFTPFIFRSTRAVSTLIIELFPPLPALNKALTLLTLI
jgi:NADPH:quinone reductase-like Zn-dependent oxidoreductase